MADPGSFLDFAKRILEGDGLRHGGDSLGEMMPPEMGKPDGSIVSPNELLKRQELENCPNCIRNEDGSFSTDQSNPFLDALKKRMGPAEHGTLRNFLERMGGNPTDVGSATGFEKPSENLDTANLSPQPLSQQPQANLQPKKNYNVPSALPPAALPQLRDSLLTGAGLDPAMYTPDGPEANSLAGRMSSPNASPEMRMQMQETEAIANAVRGGYNSVNNGTPKGNR